jgi:S-disulfanyl-L-cysteine oxidoreductase SoxD
MSRPSVFSLRSTAAIGLFATLMYACVASAQQTTVWDGIYTAQQAERGRTEYMKACASCHAQDLRGQGTAPSLVEESFAFLYNDIPLGELLDKIQKLMPSDRPGSLPPETYRDIVAFLLQANKFPAGEKELDAGPEALRRVLIVMKRP